MYGPHPETNGGSVFWHYVPECAPSGPRTLRYGGPDDLEFWRWQRTLAATWDVWTRLVR